MTKRESRRQRARKHRREREPSVQKLSAERWVKFRLMDMIKDYDREIAAHRRQAADLLAQRAEYARIWLVVFGEELPDDLRGLEYPVAKPDQR